MSIPVTSSIEPTSPARALALAFLSKYPEDAAHILESIDVETAAAVLADLPIAQVLPIWLKLSPSAAESILPALPLTTIVLLLSSLDAGPAAALLSRYPQEQRRTWFKLLKPSLRRELKELLQYPPDTAGSLMDTQAIAFNSAITVATALAQIRRQGITLLRHLYVTDSEQRLCGQIDIRKLVLADGKQALAELARPLAATLMALAPRDEVVEQLQKHKLPNLPVVDSEQRLIGVIYGANMIEALKEEIAADMQTMVGASPDERALSGSWFSVKKRLPWLQINLLTAFLASAVVGVFESTIAQYTALAILLPIAAGQSGNAGAQALAVTMRGLTLREITLRHWLRVSLKEAGAGLMNGLATALTCGAGVYVWSRSFGLALVIALAMIISMTIAGIAGALVPILLKRFGLDPAQSSSIILTTITDIAGFMSFLGIATLLSGMLG